MTADFRQDDELELTDYLRILRRRWPLVVVATGTIIALALTFSMLSEDRFDATAQVSLGNSAAQEAIQGGIYSSNPVAYRELSNEVDLALSDAVRQEVTDQLGVEPNVAITVHDTSDAIRFTATAGTADDAASHANTWAQVYVDTKRREASRSIDNAVEGFEEDLAALRTERQELRAPLDDLEDRLSRATESANRNVLEAQVARLRSDLQPELDLLDTRVQAVAENITNLELTSRLAASGTARIVQVAAPPQAPVNASLARNLTLAAIVGLIVGAAAALLAENLDRSVKTTDDLASLGLPVIGGIPGPGRHLPEAELPLATMRHTGTPVAEAYQKIRTAIEFAALSQPINSLLITSPNQAEGKSTLATNLAWAMSAVDQRVALVDVDFRRPRIHKVFNCDQSPGLADNLLSDTPLNRVALRVNEHGSRNLIVIPTGTQPPSPGDFVASPGFESLLRTIESEADMVVLDAPPVLPVSDALSISRRVDAVIVVAMAGSTTKDSLIETMENLRQVGANVIGVCLSDTKEAARYGSYDTYGSDDRRARPETGVVDVRQPETQSSTAH
jgi:capsular exopolysaccharide synthesis family protein